MGAVNRHAKALPPCVATRDVEPSWARCLSRPRRLHFAVGLARAEPSRIRHALPRSRLCAAQRTHTQRSCIDGSFSNSCAHGAPNSR